MKTVTIMNNSASQIITSYNRRPKMNRVEKLKQMKALLAKKARKEDFLAALNGKKVTPKKKISPEAAKAIAIALSGMLHS